MNKAAMFLLTLGLLQMTGDVLTRLGSQQVGGIIKGIGAATTASPAPKVFTSHRGLETFSTRFTLEWETRDGQKQSLVLTPEIYQRVRGPYNRRNVYGAVLAFGPVLITNPQTQPMFDSISRYALSGDAPLLRELGVDPTQALGAVRVRYEPRPDAPVGDWPRVIEVLPR
jgi:hypothetical protein